MSIGLIVNPVAGLGGRVALKGTDGVAARARSLGATPVAAERARRAIARLGQRLPEIRVVAAPGAMGADIVADAPFAVELLDGEAKSETSADDTREAARRLVARGVDLLLFAGGDGTTRDILDVVGSRLPMLGVPTGVKMQSAVFATTPENAGEVAAAFVGADKERRMLRDGDVVDLDEDAAREGRVVPRLYGSARVPDDRLRVQHAKTGAVPSDDVALAAVAAELADGMDPRRLYVLGPGTTMRLVAAHMGVEKTLLGVDVVRGGRLVAADADERRLLELLDGQAETLLLGVVGGQGALLGRGNQQLSPAVVRRIGLENIEVVAGLHKLLALDPPLLRVDTGDRELDAQLCGYRRVRVAPRRTVIYKVDR